MIDISRLPSIKLVDRDNLPECSGIYFVSSSGEILYIGKAINVRNRWKAHHRYMQVSANYADVCILWMEVDRALLDDIEIACIKHFRPILNGTEILSHTKQLPIRLSDVDRAALRRIVAHHTLSNEAEAVRWLIRQEDRRIAPAKPDRQEEASDPEGF